MRATFRVTLCIDPDRLTAADDQTLLDLRREQLNLPDYVKGGLSELF